MMKWRSNPRLTARQGLPPTPATRIRPIVIGGEKKKSGLNKKRLKSG
jgi:hypothetical protein